MSTVTRNQAEGYYSTASGVTNKANGDISWVAGFRNTVYDSTTPHTAFGHMVLGGNNTVTPGGTNMNESCTIGFNNTIETCYHNCVFGVSNSAKSINNYLIGGSNQINGNKGNNFVCGLSNVIPNTNSAGGIYLYGQNLHISKATGGPQHLVVLGKGTTTNIQVPATKSSLGTAIIGGSSTNFNIECYGTYTKLDLPLRLPTDDTEVDAIMPPQDPNNIIQDDKTLVTKSHLPVALLTASASLSDVDPVLDLSSVWSNVRATDNNIRFYVRINGVCYESTICNCKAVDGLLEFQRNAYDSGANTTDVYEYKFAWDHTNTTLTYTELFHYTLADNGTISNVTHTLSGATITVYGVETF